MREALTELGIDFVARQVPPWREDREELRARAGTDEIPVLETEEGELHAGTRAIFAHLGTRAPWPHARAHRRRYVEHGKVRERDATGEILEHAVPGGDWARSAG